MSELALPRSREELVEQAVWRVNFIQAAHIRSALTPHGPDCLACCVLDQYRRMLAAPVEDVMMYVCKVVDCPDSSQHDRSCCIFKHLNEPAARRDPRKVPYCSRICRRVRRRSGSPDPSSSCQSYLCPFSHSEFEAKLHPDMYCSKMCAWVAEGLECPNKICFFAHSMQEMRLCADQVQQVQQVQRRSPAPFSYFASGLPFLSSRQQLPSPSSSGAVILSSTSGIRTEGTDSEESASASAPSLGGAEE